MFGEGDGALEVEGGSWSVRSLRFLGLSPLKVNGLTILVFWCGLGECGEVR